MTLSPMTSYRPGVLVAVLSLALCGTSAFGNGTETEDSKPPGDLAGPSLCQVYESGSNGYSLRCPKRPDPYRGTNIGLQAAYRIGKAAPKQAEVFQDAISWLVHIPERVLPGDEVQLKLSFRYAPSELAREALRRELQKFNETVVSDVIQALQKHGENWTTHLAIDPNANQYELLKTARSKDDSPAIPDLLKGLGFEQDPASQKWKPTDKTLNLLNEVAQKKVKQGWLKPAELDVAKKGAKVCSTLLTRAAPAETPKVLIEMAAQCIGRIPSEAANDSTRIEAEAAAKNEKTNINGKACRQVLDPLPALSGFNEATSDDDIVKMSAVLDRAQTDADKVCPKSTVDQLASVASLLTLTRHVNASRLATEEALKEQLDAVAAVIEVNVDLPDSRSQWLQADAERRGYSLSSGAVYLVRMNDLVYPVSVSFCPVGGCLRGAEQFWSSWGSVGRSFSAEVGIAAVTADKFDDARRRNGPGFLLGLSWQGLAPFKLSGGTLFFENQEARRWQFDGYLGLTLDAAKAIEMMGLFGASVPIQLKSIGSKPSS